ncbi:MAG: hypothetical protein NVS3B10_22970 [Polyangiales bacterium]
MRFAGARVQALLLSTVLLGGSAVAHAEPSAADIETARAEFNAGLGLRDKGDAPGALPHLLTANSLVTTPITAVELGRTQLLVGQLVEALESFMSVARIPPRPNESKNAARAREDASKLATEVEPRIPSLRVRAKAGSATPAVTIDGATISSLAANAPRKLDPGKHEVVVRAEGYVEQAQTVVLVEREARELEVVLVPSAASTTTSTALSSTTTATTTAGVAAAPGPSGDADPTAARKASPLVWIGFGVAGVGAVVGAVTGIATLGKASKVKDECPDQRCTTPAGQSDLDSAHTLGAVSTVSFALAGAGVVVGVIGLLGGSSRSESPTAAHVTPYVGLGGAGLTGSF